MVNRKTLFVIICLLIVLMIGVVMITPRKYSPSIKAFNVNEYKYFLENCSSEGNIGAFSDVEDLVNKVETIWIEKYGNHINVKDERPYQISYDETNGVWLVQGSLPSGWNGGVANILVEEESGRILALWHDQ